MQHGNIDFQKEYDTALINYIDKHGPIHEGDFLKMYRLKIEQAVIKIEIERAEIPEVAQLDPVRDGSITLDQKIQYAQEQADYKIKVRKNALKFLDLLASRLNLKPHTPTENPIKKKNAHTKHLLLSWLNIVSYFETDNVKIQLFTCGNDTFKSNVLLDLDQVRAAEQTNTKEYKPSSSRDLFSTDKIIEAEVAQFAILFKDKFEEAVESSGIKTEAYFAKYELEQIYNGYSGIGFVWFPVLKQWCDFLKQKTTERTNISHFTNKFNELEESLVEEYFKKELVAKGYLSPSELQKFLKFAFELKEPPDQKFQFVQALCSKGEIHDIFYRFYNDTSNRPSKKQGLYAALLGDYFVGYKTPSVKSNFSRYSSKPKNNY